MIKAIIFDIGGVILLYLDDSSNRIFEEFGKALRISPEESRAFHAKYLDRMLVGKMTASQFFAAYKKHFHIKSDIRKKWTAIAIGNVKLNRQILGIADRLHKHYRTALLSNATQLRVAIDDHFKIYSHFDEVFVSYKLKGVKPTKKTYEAVLNKLKLKPEEVLFIDDKEANLAVARTLGIKCIQFNNNAQLTTEFKRIGLL